MQSFRALRDWLSAGLKFLVAGSIALAIFAVLTFTCLARDCTCRIRQITTIRIPDEGVSVMAVDAARGRLFVSHDNDVEIGIYDIDDLEVGPVARVPTDGFHGDITFDDQANFGMAFCSASLDIVAAC